MRIARVLLDEPRLGVVVGHKVRLLDRTRSAAACNDVVNIDTVLDDLRRLASDDLQPTEVLPLASAQLLSPVGAPSKIIAVGHNYRDAGSQPGPPDPVIAAKFASAIIGPDASIVIDSTITSDVRAEGELAVVVGRRARRVPVERALGHVLGYTCCDDVTAHDLQEKDGQWVRGKSLDTFCPLGPWLVTADALAAPQSLRIRCSVGAEVIGDASTAAMRFGVAELVARLSEWFTLEPGDIIATGAPRGVEGLRIPPRPLANGDVVSVEIEGIGVLRNMVSRSG